MPAFSPEAIRQQYPQLAFLLDSPEIGPILQMAYEENWAPARFQAAIMATEWWRSHSTTQRSFIAMAHSDPAELARLIQERQLEVERVAGALGLNLGISSYELGKAALFWGWDEAEMRRQLVHYSRSSFNERSPFVNRVRQMARSYFMPISNDTLFEMARRLAAGQETEENVRAMMVSWARGMFPHLADQLDAGLTIEQFAEPYRQTIARLMEVSPDTVDFMGDDRWRKVLAFTDDKGDTRAMSLTELGEHVRSQHDWRGTGQGRAAGAEVAEFLAREFGKVA